MAHAHLCAWDLSSRVCSEFERTIQQRFVCQRVQPEHLGVDIRHVIPGVQPQQAAIGHIGPLLIALDRSAWQVHDWMDDKIELITR